MVNSEAYKIVESFVKENMGKYHSGKGYGEVCYYSNERLRSLVEESTAYNYACLAMIELGMRDKRKVEREAEPKIICNLNRSKAEYSQEELIEKLEGIEFLGKGMYKSIRNNNMVRGTNWDPVSLIELNKHLFANWDKVKSGLDIERLYLI